MKKEFLNALMGATALVSAICFTACTDEEVADVNPTYDPESNTVVVDLAFNISTANTPTTRMSAAATQATTDQTFRGISDAKLFTFAQSADGMHIYNGNTAIKSRYDLSQVILQGQISGENTRRVLEMALPLHTNSMIFYGRATKKSTDTPDAVGLLDTDDTHAQNVDADKLSDFTFSINRRLKTVDKDNYHKMERLLAGILTCIMNVNFEPITATEYANDGITATGKPGNVVTVYGQDVALKEIKNTGEEGCRATAISWKSYGDAIEGGKSPLTTTKALDQLELKLGRAYNQMTTIQGDAGELRSASGEAIIRMIKDLWTEVNATRCAQPFSKEEAVAKYLAHMIFKEIDTYFDATYKPNGGDDGNIISGVSFRSLSHLIEKFKADKYWPIAESALAEADQPYYKRESMELSALTGSAAMTSDMKEPIKFPGSFGLPVGASHVKFGKETGEANNISANKFYYPHKFNTSGVNNVDFTVDDYLYPAELLYFGNSPIRVSNTEHKVGDYPTNASYKDPTRPESSTNKTVLAWDDEDSWSTGGWVDNSYVTSSTRSVAMKYDINYGTALLKTTVSYGDKDMKDNNHAIQGRLNGKSTAATDPYNAIENGNYTDEPDKIIKSSDNPFTLTGIIIGGQSKNVGWNFLPRTVNVGTAESPDNQYQYGFITDNDIPDGSIPTSSPNYTLVFDNYNKDKADGEQDEVYIALEFLNSGEDFFGNFNLIPSNSKFYLIGKLNPNDKTKPTWPTYHKLPPYNESTGASLEVRRVFMQDYMTSVNFVFGENSLKYAYLTVPDLRASSLSLGLSVNIEWSTGIDFGSITMGQNDF